MIKLKKPSLGFILIAISFVCTVVAFILFLSTYDVFSYELNRWALTCSVLAIWGLLFLGVNTLIKGENPVWTFIIYAVIVFLLTYAVIQFIKPCLSPIGIYFTVKNMGDTATNEIGVPRALITTGFYLVSIICCTISSFVKSTNSKEVDDENI